MENKRKVTRILFNVLILVISCVLIFSLYKLYTIWREYHNNQKTQEQVQALFYGEISGDAQAVSNPGIGKENSETSYSFHLAPVKEANPDTVGWIRIPGTVVDYAVVQAADNEEYLHKGFFGEANAAGTIFMDYRNQMGQPLQNWIIYGHRMKDDSMFGELGEYLNYGFYQQHPSFTFFTEDGAIDCEVFSVYRCTTEVDYCQPAFASGEEMLQYVQACKDRSEYKVVLDVTAEDTIITLSTCDYDLDPTEGRLVIHAKLSFKGNENE